MFPVIDFKVIGARVAQVALVFALGFLVYRGEPSNQANGVPPPASNAVDRLCVVVQDQSVIINKAIAYALQISAIARDDSNWLGDHSRDRREQQHYAITSRAYGDLIERLADLRGGRTYCPS